MLSLAPEAEYEAIDCTLCFIRHHPRAVIPAFRDIHFLILHRVDDASLCHSCTFSKPSFLCAVIINKILG